MSKVAAAPGDLDLWLAIAAGPPVWADDEPDGGLELLGGLLAAVVLAVAVVPLVARNPRLDDPGALAAAVLGLAVGTVVLLVVPGSLALGQPAPDILAGRPYVAAMLRLSAALTFVVCWLVLAPLAALPLLSLLGVVVGGEAAVTARSLGVPVEPRRWLAHFLRSWLHVGFLTAVIVALVLDRQPEAVRTVAGLMVVAYASVLLALATARWADGALATVERRADDQLQRHAENEDRRRSHWLHDDVLGMLTGVQMRLEREQWDTATTAAELRWLDHQLRLRQTEEIVRSGTATIGEVVQPYLRHAQNLRVTVSEVPAWEVASLRLDQRDARRVQRVFGVAVPNALAAGATTIAIRVGNPAPGLLVLEVEDDAGGFDVDLRIPGRGLDVLERELPPGALELRRTTGGTVVRAELAVGEP